MRLQSVGLTSDDEGDVRHRRYLVAWHHVLNRSCLRETNSNFAVAYLALHERLSANELLDLFDLSLWSSDERSASVSNGLTSVRAADGRASAENLQFPICSLVSSTKISYEYRAKFYMISFLFVSKFRLLQESLFWDGNRLIFSKPEQYCFVFING